MRAGYHPGQKDKEGKATLKEQGFYQKTAWRRIRKLALQRDHYICQLRISQKCTHYATEVHHIKALEDYPELGLDVDNLISCCWFCHEETKERRPKERATAPGVRVIRMKAAFDEETEEGGSKKQTPPSPKF